MLIKKEFAKIGKHVLRQLSGSVEKYIIHEVEPEHVEGEQEDRYTYEASPVKEKISTIHTRLSKTQILQFLLYHFLHVDERGIIRNINEKDIAETIGCTVKTVQNNNVIFEELGLIYFSRSSSGINIKLVEYPRYFDENGYGYIELSFERFEELKEIKNINALRLEIRKELVYDNNEAKRKFKNDYSPCKISFHDFKTFTPKYTHYRAMLEQIVRQGTKAFKTIIKDNNIYFDLEKGVYSSKLLKEKKKEEYTNSILKYLEQRKALGFISQQDIQDFVQLSFEYSLNCVLSALDTLINEEFILGIRKPTLNYGGRLRTIIRQQLAAEERVQLIS
jgi:hypothetical protein